MHCTQFALHKWLRLIRADFPDNDKAAGDMMIPTVSSATSKSMTANSIRRFLGILLTVRAAKV